MELPVTVQQQFDRQGFLPSSPLTKALAYVRERQAGIIQSLLVTCRLQGLDPYDYLVDVLQRLGQHPADRVHELTPRLWKQLFAANPLRSDLYSIGK